MRSSLALLGPGLATPLISMSILEHLKLRGGNEIMRCMKEGNKLACEKDREREETLNKGKRIGRETLPAKS